MSEAGREKGREKLHRAEAPALNTSLGGWDHAIEAHPQKFRLKIAESGLEEKFKEWEATNLTKNLSPETIRFYRDTYKKFITFTGATKPSDITGETIQKYVASLLQSGLAEQSVNTNVRGIRPFLYYLMEEGHIRRQKIKLVRADEPVKEFYTDDELNRLLPAPPPPAPFTTVRDWAAINWLLATGNRAGSVVGIQIQDIDIEGAEVILRRTKARKQQVVPLCDDLKKVMKKYIGEWRSDAGPNDYVFCNQYGGALTTDALKHSVGHFNQSRGVERTSIHAFRHTFARKYILAGGDVFRLQKLLGHSTLDMTRKYVNLFTTDLKKGYEEINPLSTIMAQHRAKQRGAIIKKKKT